MKFIMINRSYFKENERAKIISEVLTLLPGVVVIISTKFQRDLRPIAST